MPPAAPFRTCLASVPLFLFIVNILVFGVLGVSTPPGKAERQSPENPPDAHQASGSNLADIKLLDWEQPRTYFDEKIPGYSIRQPLEGGLVYINPEYSIAEVRALKSDNSVDNLVEVWKQGLAALGTHGGGFKAGHCGLYLGTVSSLESHGESSPLLGIRFEIKEGSRDKAPMSGIRIRVDHSRKDDGLATLVGFFQQVLSSNFEIQESNHRLLIFHKGETQPGFDSFDFNLASKDERRLLQIRLRDRIGYDSPEFFNSFYKLGKILLPDQPIGDKMKRSMSVKINSQSPIHVHHQVLGENVQVSVLIQKEAWFKILSDPKAAEEARLDLKALELFTTRVTTPLLEKSVILNAVDGKVRDEEGNEYPIFEYIGIKDKISAARFFIDDLMDKNQLIPERGQWLRMFYQYLLSTSKVESITLSGQAGLCEGDYTVKVGSKTAQWVVHKYTSQGAASDRYGLQNGVTMIEDALEHITGEAASRTGPSTVDVFYNKNPPPFGWKEGALAPIQMGYDEEVVYVEYRHLDKTMLDAVRTFIPGEGSQNPIFRTMVLTKSHPNQRSELNKLIMWIPLDEQIPLNEYGEWDCEMELPRNYWSGRKTAREDAQDDLNKIFGDPRKKEESKRRKRPREER